MIPILPSIRGVHQTRDGSYQGISAVVAAIDIHMGESRLQAAMAVPVMPVIIIGAGVKWAVDRIGSIALALAALLVIGGFIIYQRQSQDKKDAIKKVARDTAGLLIEKTSEAATSIQKAQYSLNSYVVSAPLKRSATAAVIRELALAQDSMSAKQLYEVLDDSVRLSIVQLRTFLHANKNAVFGEVRRGGFVLGQNYLINNKSIL